MPFHHGKNYYVLKKYNWLLLKNKNDIKYRAQPWMDKRLGRMMTTYDYMEWVMGLDNNFRELHKLKEPYVAFNKRYAGKPKEAQSAFPEIFEIFELGKKVCKFVTVYPSMVKSKQP